MSVNHPQIEMLRKLLRHGASDRVLRVLDKFRTAEIAEIFGYLSPAEQRQFLQLLLEHPKVGQILVELPQGILGTLFSGISEDRIAAVLETLPVDDALFLVNLLDEQRAEAILASVEPIQRERIEHLRTYPPESAGRLMTSQMITLDESMTTQAAIEAIRERGEDSEFVFYVYVVNAAGTFLGVVPLRSLILSGPERLISEIMVSDPVAVFATDDQEEVAAVTARYDLLAVPVVDENFRLLGVITVDDVLDVLRDEATEDMYLMQGLSGEDRVYAPISHSVRKRFPWMVLNLCTASLAASVIGLFEASISKAVVLATFMPIVAGLGGNGGTQTLTVITRAIALGELSFSEGRKAIAKQLGIGIIVGAGLGLLTGVVAWIWKGNMVLGGVLFGAILINQSIAGLAGAAAPLLLKAMNLDPALGGGILVTTFTDMFGFLAFLGLATMFLQYLI
jgi:magnesium transporter